MSGLLLLVLIGCPAPSSDTNKPGDSSACEDSCGCQGCETADDTAGDTLLFDVCGDGVDNDGNGETDELGCVRAWVSGSYASQELPGWLAVASEDPTLWAYSADAEDNADTLGSLAMDDLTHSLSGTWSTFGAAGWPLLAPMVVAGTPMVAYTTPDENYADHLDIAEVPAGGSTATDVVVTASFSVRPVGAVDDIRSLDGTVESDTLSVVCGLAGGMALVIHNVGEETGELSERAALSLSFGDDPENEHLFGWGVGFVPDDGGDGIREVAVGAPGPYNSQFRSPPKSAVYIFDGTLSGSLTSADADAVVGSSNSPGTGDDVGRMGDLDGDGYDDLVIGADGAVQLWFGPFAGTMEVDDVTILSAYALAGQFSANGDEWPDLAIGGRDDGVSLYSGPLERGTFDADDADYTIPTPWIEWTGRSSMIFADADADGTIELIVGDPEYGSEGSTPGPGLIAVFDLTGW